MLDVCYVTWIQSSQWQDDNTEVTQKKGLVTECNALLSQHHFFCFLSALLAALVLLSAFIQFFNLMLDNSQVSSTHVFLRYQQKRLTRLLLKE